MYQEMRELIQDGDFIFFRAESVRQKAICLITGGMHSHCGIATWMTDATGARRLMLVESFVGGCRMVTMSSYASRGIDVVRVRGLVWHQLADLVLDKTGVVHYGMFDFVTIGLRDLSVRIGLGRRWLKWIPDGRGQVCSEMLADVLSRIHPMRTTLLSPSGLFKLMAKRELGYLVNS